MPRYTLYAPKNPYWISTYFWTCFTHQDHFGGHPKHHPHCWEADTSSQCRASLGSQITTGELEFAQGHAWKCGSYKAPHISFWEGGTCSRASCCLGPFSLVILLLDLAIFTCIYIIIRPPPSDFSPPWDFARLTPPVGKGIFKPLTFHLCEVQGLFQVYQMASLGIAERSLATRTLQAIKLWCVHERTNASDVPHLPLTRGQERLPHGCPQRAQIWRDHDGLWDVFYPQSWSGKPLYKMHSKGWSRDMQGAYGQRGESTMMGGSNRASWWDGQVWTLST